MTNDRVHTEHEYLRHCRRLLLAYPGPYRRRHGEEILTTLLDMRSPGQRHPTLRDAAHLFGSGLRQRFRLPADRPLAMIASTLVALTLGAFGAAAGSWAGVQTFAELPDDATMAALARRASDIPANESTIYRSGSSPWAEKFITMSTQFDGWWNAGLARQRFAADGWVVSGVMPRNDSGFTYDPYTHAQITNPIAGSQFTARADGVTLHVSGEADQVLVRTHRMKNDPIPYDVDVRVDAWAQSTPVFLPSIGLGTIAGLTVGWLLTATVAYRLRRTPRGRRGTATILSALALLLLLLPTVALYGSAWSAFQHNGEPYAVMTVHSAFTPGPYYLVGPDWLILALTTAGIVTAVASIALATPAPHPPTRRVPIPN
jgi:hypothetical protein